MIRLLFVDDDPRAHDTLELVLPQQYELLSAATLAEGERVVAGGDVDLVLLDLVLPDGSGLELLRRVRGMPLGPPVVVLTGHADVRMTVDALRAGANDYLVKPYELRTLLATLHCALVNSTARRNSGSQPLPADGLVGEAPSLLQVRELMEVYADSDAPAMVIGESGTGKELVARGIHRLSHRATAPFIAVNCGAIPETLVESELFGSAAGAFTGAVSRAGCFERADGGTLFLDEVAEMPLDAQVKLLRALENHEVTRVAAATRSRSTYAWSAPPIATSKHRWRPAPCGRISGTGWRCCSSTCRRCASGAMTSRCWPICCCGRPLPVPGASWRPRALR